jgi:hypothetical protein
MGWLSNGCRDNGGTVLGVIHEKFCVDSDEDNLIVHKIVVGGKLLASIVLSTIY